MKFSALLFRRRHNFVFQLNLAVGVLNRQLKSYVNKMKNVKKSIKSKKKKVGISGCRT